MSAPLLLPPPYPRERDPRDGSTTCLWHRQHEHYLRFVAPYARRCDICGGRTPRESARHELCRLRKEAGLQIAVLDYVRKCPCARCCRERGEVRS